MTEPAQNRHRLLVGLGVGVAVLLLVVGVLGGLLIAKGGGDNDSAELSTSSASSEDESGYDDDFEPYIAPTTTYTSPTTSYTPRTAYVPTPPPTSSYKPTPTPGRTYASCPTGDIVARIDKAELVDHREGSEYYDYRFTSTVTNNKSGAVDWYYFQVVVNGDPENDTLLKDETYNSAAVHLEPGQSYTWTHRPLVISSPNGPPSFSVGKISWLWPSGANYPPDCRKNP